MFFFSFFFYQKGKSSRIRFYFRNKVRFHGRKKQSLGVEKVCSFSIALLKCPYASIILSMFGSSHWGKWLNLTLFWCLRKGMFSILRAYLGSFLLLLLWMKSQSLPSWLELAGDSPCSRVNHQPISHNPKSLDRKQINEGWRQVDQTDALLFHVL